MRVAQVSLDGNLPRYGIGQAVVRLCEALAAAGDEVHLLCRPAGAAAVAPRRGLRVTPLVHRDGLLGGSGSYVRQIRRALAPGVDVVHVHAATRVAHWLLPRRARRGAPLVVTCHSSDELGPAGSPAGGDPGSRRARRHARQVDDVLGRADAVTAPSRWMAGLVRARSGGARDVEVVPLGPSSDGTASPARHDGFVVLALARFVPIKGLDLLVRAFASALGSDPGSRLVLAGDGPQDEELRALATSLGVASRVEFPGYLEGSERDRALAGADVVVIPTLSGYETFGLTALDAGMHGVPLVAIEGGALMERLEGGTGIGVPLGSAEAVVAGLAGALARLRGEPVLRRRLGEAGRVAAGLHSWERVAAAFRSCYARALGTVADGRPRAGGGGSTRDP